MKYNEKYGLLLDDMFKQYNYSRIFSLTFFKFGILFTFVKNKCIITLHYWFLYFLINFFRGISKIFSFVLRKA